MPRTIVVNVEWDPEAEVWLAESDGVPGLVTGADTMEGLIDRLKVAIPEMLAENNIPIGDGLLFRIEAVRAVEIAA